MSPRRFLAGLVACCCAALPAVAAAEEPANPLAEFQRREGQLFDTGWQLARANRAFCARTKPSIGLLIHDAANYARAAEVRRALQLTGDIGVQAAAKGSPAALGGIGPNWTLHAIDSFEVGATWKPSRPTVQRTLDIEAAIDRSLADGEVVLALENGPAQVKRSTAYRGVDICAANFRLTPGDAAYASADTVFFGDGFMGFGLRQDLFAAAVAHELAHVIQQHAAHKERERWGWRETRESEREADRMMPWLLFNAGHDPASAAAWMQAWGPRYSGGLLRKRTHDGWDERHAMILAEIAELRRLVTANGWAPGEADWAARFPAKSR